MRYYLETYVSFLRHCKQSVVYRNQLCEWTVVNQGTTQRSVIDPQFFNYFINDLGLQEEACAILKKHADNSTVQTSLHINLQDSSYNFQS